MKKKVIIITFLAVTTLCIFCFLGLRGFVSSISKQRNCDWANIDNIEIHAEVDIPKVKKLDCYYDLKNNTKKAFFVIDTFSVDMDQYIESNKLKRVPHSYNLDSTNFLQLETKSLDISELYYRQNQSKSKSYEVLFDSKAAKLWVTIRFNDELPSN